MATLGADSLCPNTLLNKTINIYMIKLFQNPETSVNGISIKYFRHLLNFSTKESFFYI